MRDLFVALAIALSLAFTGADAASAKSGGPGPQASVVAGDSAASLVRVSREAPPVLLATDVAVAHEPMVASGSDTAPYVLGLGAIAGVVGFNILALGWEAVPYAAEFGPGATVSAEMSVAMSRVYATTSAVVGALIANSIYRR